jgi:hypothetical protein
MTLPPMAARAAAVAGDHLDLHVDEAGPGGVHAGKVFGPTLEDGVALNLKFTGSTHNLGQL